MMALRPLVKPKVLKKEGQEVLAPDSYVQIKCQVWKSRRVDHRVWRRFKGQRLMLDKGYGSREETKPMLPSGFPRVLVHTGKELKCCGWATNSTADVTHTSFENHKTVMERAAQPGRQSPPSWHHATLWRNGTRARFTCVYIRPQRLQKRKAEAGIRIMTKF